MTLNELILAVQALVSENPALGNRKVIVGDRRQNRYGSLSGVCASGFTFEHDDPSRVDCEFGASDVSSIEGAEHLLKIEYD